MGDDLELVMFNVWKCFDCGKWFFKKKNSLQDNLQYCPMCLEAAVEEQNAIFDLIERQSTI